MALCKDSRDERQPDHAASKEPQDIAINSMLQSVRVLIDALVTCSAAQGRRGDCSLGGKGPESMAA